MPSIPFTDVIDRVTAAVASGGWTVDSVQPQPLTRPARISVRRAGRRCTLLVYGWSATHGGGPKRASDEFRVQMTSVAPPLQIQPGAQTLLLGLSRDLGVITAWDASKHVTFTKGSPSLQTKFAALERALMDGWGFHRRRNGEVVVSFLDDYLMSYVETQSELHMLGTRDLAGLQRLAREETRAVEQGSPAPPDEPVPDVAPAARLVRQSIRDSSFPRRVLRAYQYTCCVCGTQLNIVEAAHIIPVADAPNFSTRNGIALCPTHHAAYDAALFFVDEKMRITINKRRIRELRAAQRAGGEAIVLGTLATTIRLPANNWESPARNFLRIANASRLRRR